MQHLLSETGAESINQLGKMLLPDSNGDFGVKAGSKWSAYASDESSPNDTTLTRVNVKVPGSQAVFQTGPLDSHLFTSIWADLSHIHLLLDRAGGDTSHGLFWLNQLLPNGYLRQIDDEGLKAIIGGLAKLLHEEKFAMEGARELGIVPTRLSFLSGCFAILRFCIDRDNYHRYSYVFEVVDLILECIVQNNFSESLKKLDIKTEVLIRLYSELSVWSEYSQAGVYYKFNARFPTEEEFLFAPRNFHQRYSKIKFPHSENFAEYYLGEEEDEMAADNRYNFDLLCTRRI